MALATVLALLALAAPAQAGITGIADENLEQWSPASWVAFEATSVKQVRHIVPWDVAMPGHAAELQEATNWINAAKARNLQILISFGYNGCTDSTPSKLAAEGKTCEHPSFPSEGEYLTAVGRFREQFPSITTYTAWNEPNHFHSSTYLGGGSANPSGYPEVAARYWYNLNYVCGLASKYGSTCTVVAGDFSDETTTTSLKAYVTAYKKELSAHGVTPTAWAIHPYKTIRTNDRNMLKEAFISQTTGPIWFTEAGGLYCETTAPGYTGTGNTPQSAEAFQNAVAQNYLGLIAEQSSRVQRSYYYALAAPGGSGPTCPLPGTSDYRWDSNLLTATGSPRLVYRTLFPTGLGSFPKVSTGPAVVKGPDQFQVFRRGTDGSLQHKGFTPLGWASWQSLGGSLAGNPVAISWGGGHMDVYVRWTDGTLRHIFYLPSSGWSAWENLGGTLNGDPSVVSWGSGRADVFVRGTDNGVWHKWFDGTAWSPNWESLGGSITSDPASISWQAGTLNVFARGSSGSLVQTWYTPTTGWSSWQNLGGSISSKPVALTWGYGHMDVYARGADNAVWHTWFGGSPPQWQPWSSLGGVVQGTPAAAAWSYGSANIFVRGTDNNLWQTWFGGAPAEWHSWSSLGGQIASDPYAVSTRYGQLGVFAVGSSGEVGSSWFGGEPGNWNNFAPLP